MSEVAPYSVLARHYDRMMGHVAYEDWAQALRKIIKRSKVKVSRLLELGAGTCNLAKHMDWPELKLRVHTDLSLEMVQAAGVDFPYSRAVCNATQLPFGNASFDFILMSYDAVNYLDEDQLSELFAEVQRVLIPGGIFIFDITTEKNSLEWFTDYSDAFEVEGCMLVRRSAYEQDTRIQHNYIDVFEPVENGLFRKVSEHHQQFIHSVPSLIQSIQNSDLEVMGLWDGQSLKEATPLSERIHVLVGVP